MAYKLCFHEKKIPRFSCQDIENSVKHPKKWYRKNVQMNVCACLCMCVRTCVRTSENSNICISGITQPVELKFEVSFWSTRFAQFLIKFNQLQSRMTQVNWFFKPLCFVNGQISSKTGRKVVQKNYAVLYRSIFLFPFINIHYFTVCVKRKVYCLF